VCLPVQPRASVFTSGAQAEMEKHPSATPKHWKRKKHRDTHTRTASHMIQQLQIGSRLGQATWHLVLGSAFWSLGSQMGHIRRHEEAQKWRPINRLAGPRERERVTSSRKQSGARWGQTGSAERERPQEAATVSGGRSSGALERLSLVCILR